MGEHSLYPLRDAVCGLPGALSLTWRTPDEFTRDQWTEIVHEAPAARLVPQLSVWVKAPVVEISLIVRDAVPRLLRVVVVCVMHWQPALITFLQRNNKLVGESVAFGPEFEAVVFVPDW